MLRVSIVQSSYIKNLKGQVVFGDSIRIRKIIQTLQELGIDVSEIQLPKISKKALLTPSRLGNFSLNILPIHTSKNLPFSTNTDDIIKQLEFTLSINHLYKELHANRPDVVLSETSEVGWISSLVTKKMRLPCIIDAHGLLFAEQIGNGYQNWKKTFLREKEGFQNCQHLVVVSEKMKEYVSNEMGIEKSKITIVPNGSDLISPNAKYEKPLNVIYAGLFAYWEKVHDFLDLAKKAPKQHFKFFLAGKGANENQIIDRIKQEDIPINYLGYVPKQKISKLLSKMQIGIAPSTKDLARQIASPIKVFDYMAAGLPVVTPNIGDWGQLIEKEDAGIALANDSIESYVEALETLTDEYTWTRKSSNSLRVISSQYSWNKVIEPIGKLLLNYARK